MIKQPKVGGMCLWNVEIEYDGWTRIESKTLTIATRRKLLTDAQKKAQKHLRAFRYDYPKAKIVGIGYYGIVHE